VVSRRAPRAPARRDDGRPHGVPRRDGGRLAGDRPGVPRRAGRAKNVALGPATEAGRLLAAACARAGAPAVVPYDRPVEEIKAALFEDIDAGFTTVRSAIADTGSLVLWPSPEEPRLLSLVPPLHVALLSAAAIRDTLLGVMREEGWAKGLPPNALLVSGPSKTADIEQTLAYGVHGPKRLVVVVVP
jgi:L-lactate dehydrogenase complex protein LldG